MDTDTQAFYREVGRRLARRRRLVGLRQRDVAQMLGWQRAHLSGWERGKYQAMKLAQLVQLADVLQTSVDYLLARVEDDPGAIPPWPCSGGSTQLCRRPTPPCNHHHLRTVIVRSLPQIAGWRAYAQASSGAG